MEVTPYDSNPNPNPNPKPIILPYKGMDSRKDFSKPPALKKG